MKQQYLKIAYFYFLAIFCSSVVLYLIIVSVAPNPVTLNYDVPFKNSINALAPQGWAFFTKDVKTDYFNIYDQNKTEVSLKAAGSSQYFGLRRDNRIINHKIGNLLSNIDPKFWYSYKGDVKKIPNDSLTKIAIKISEPMIYGTYLIEKGKPMPYEWYLSRLKVHQTMNYVLVEIKK